jgi:tRNA threonylcarbamoyladenosine biosynthesis protein TsaB
MRVLALETSTLAGGVALCEDGRVVGLSVLNVALTHSERLMSMVDRLLEDCRWTLGQVQGLAVSIGPGSFTGLRVGAATVKGLSLALGLPVAAVPTLDALAANLPFADALVCPLLDARKGEVYVCRYRWAGQAMERNSDYLALSPPDVAEWLRPPVILLGDGVPACRPYLVGLGDDRDVRDPATDAPQVGEGKSEDDGNHDDLRESRPSVPHERFQKEPGADGGKILGVLR